MASNGFMGPKRLRQSEAGSILTENFPGRRAGGMMMEVIALAVVAASLVGGALYPKLGTEAFRDARAVTNPTQATMRWWRSRPRRARSAA